MKSQTFFSPGKLLLTAEYLVLDGALALALPTKRGQSLQTEYTEDELHLLHWETYREGRLWLQLVYDYQKKELLEGNLPEPAWFMKKVFDQVGAMQTPRFNGASYHLKSNVEFPADWGLGSSSTLMTNLASWAAVDPFELNQKALGGSGYDIAVAQTQSALLYHLTPEGRIVEPIAFDPDFKEELIFIHLKKKQDTREGISDYKKRKPSLELISKITAITQEVLSVTKLEDFEQLMCDHEKLIAQQTGFTPVKELYFKDCPVFVKSLGAWGGDFVMSRKFPNYEAYFKARGFDTIIVYADMIRS